MNWLKGLYINLFKSKFAKNIVLVAGGTAFAQAMGVIFSPIITRIYPPDEYGILTVYSAVLGLIAISASLDYQKAIPIAADDEKAINLLALSIIILILFVALTILILALCGGTVLNIIDSETLLNYKYLIPVGVLFTGIYDIFIQWAYRMRNYKDISKTKVSQSITANLIKITLGLLKIGPIGLIFGTILGQSAGITTLSLPIIQDKKITKKINSKEIINMAKRYVKFPLYSATSNYVYTAGTQLPILFLTSLFGSTVIGLFGLANSIISLPMNLIGTSVAQVFYAEAAKIGKTNPKELKRLSVQITKKLAIIGLIPLIIIISSGPWLFSFVFGSQWHGAGLYAQIISVMIYFHFIIMPLGRVLEIFERQREGLLLNILSLSAFLSCFGFAKFLQLNAYQTVALYSFLGSSAYLLLFIVVQFIINDEIKKKISADLEL